MDFELKFASFPLPDGPLRYAEVPWDTETFGFPVYDLRLPAQISTEVNDLLERLLANLATNCPNLVVCRTGLPPAGAVAAVLARHGFYPVETLVELHLSLARFRPIVGRVPDTLQLRLAQPAEQPAIQNLARASLQADRFHADPFLDPARAGQRFADWIRRAFEQAEPVYVFEDLSERRLIGFYHVREFSAPEKKVDLALAAIAREQLKTGMGLLMYQQVLMEYQARGFALAETRVTVGNMDVLNLFVRLGFAMRKPAFTFHRYCGRSGVASID